MEEKLICCCGSSCWTRVIGWLEVVCNAIGILSLSFLLAATIESQNLLNSSKVNAGDKAVAQFLITMGTAVTGFELVLLVLGFLMAIVLLKGSYNRNPNQIQAWIIYASIFLFLHVLMTIVECIALGNSGAQFVGTMIWGKVLYVTVIVTVQGFFIWVVYTHRMEILSVQNRIYPVKV